MLQSSFKFLRDRSHVEWLLRIGRAQFFNLSLFLFVRQKLRVQIRHLVGYTHEELQEFFEFHVRVFARPGQLIENSHLCEVE